MQKRSKVPFTLKPGCVFLIHGSFERSYRLAFLEVTVDQPADDRKQRIVALDKIGDEQQPFPLCRANQLVGLLQIERQRLCADYVNRVVPELG